MLSVKTSKAEAVLAKKRQVAVKKQLIEFGTKPDIITLLDIEIQSKGEGNNFVEFIEVK